MRASSRPSFECIPDTFAYGLLEGIPVLGMVGSLLMVVVADRLLKDYGSLIGLLSMAGMFLIAAQPTTVPLVIDGCGDVPRTLPGNAPLTMP